MADPSPQQILALNPSPVVPVKKGLPTGWIIFWLLVFTPVGIWQVVKSSWPVWLKLVVSLGTGILFVVLLIESVLLPLQIATSVVPQ